MGKKLLRPGFNWLLILLKSHEAETFEGSPLENLQEENLDVALPVIGS